MVARGRKVVSGMVTGSLPVRSTHKVPYDRVKVMLELGVATVLLVLASPIILLCLDEITLSKASTRSASRISTKGSRWLARSSPRLLPTPPTISRSADFTSPPDGVTRQAKNSDEPWSWGLECRTRG